MPMPDSIEMVQNQTSAPWIWMVPLPIAWERSKEASAPIIVGVSQTPLTRFPKQQNAQAPGLSDPLPSLGM